MGLQNTDCGATVNFANWYLHGVYGTETDPTLFSFSNNIRINITGLLPLRICYFLKPSNCMRNYDISQQDNAKACTENYSMYSLVSVFGAEYEAGDNGPQI
jgi:hypothetical protein